jgi:hypothetical protein
MPDVTKVRVRLAYETRDGKQIPIPDNYPDEVEFTGVPSAFHITNDMIWAAVSADLREHGAEIKDVVISWTALDSTPHSGKLQ